MTMRALLFAAAALLPATFSAGAQQPAPERLAPHLFDVTPPSAWASGPLDRMIVAQPVCRSVPEGTLRQRIVEIAIQEWAFFGFPVLDRMNGARLLPRTGLGSGRIAFEYTTRRPPAPDAREGERVAASIAGYWAVTPEGAGIVREQTRRWDRSGAGARWNAPWSAAFISWVMCEGGLETPDRFRRAIAHWSYVDQAIRARDAGIGAGSGGGRANAGAGAGYLAYDIGEVGVEPGDLLCSARRPRYRNLADRRRQMGEGASTHCDIVVEVDSEGERILAIGGNVLRAVSLKVLPGRKGAEGGVRALSTPEAPLYAHLKLRAEPIGPRALGESSVLAAFAQENGALVSIRASLVLAALGVEGPWAEGEG